ncbi:MAG: sigma-70 family RNA polymerase sigma factor [Candidatus Brocadiia bacterium]
MPEAHAGDDLLVARAQSGDVEAFGQLVERYQDALYNGIHRMVASRQDAEDLAQEAFVKAFRGIEAFRSRSSFYTWLYAIAVNVAISHRRKQGSSRRLNPVSIQATADETGHAMDVVDQGPRPEEPAANREAGQRIEEAIDQLDDDHRTVVVLRDIEGFDYQTIAGMLDCPQGTVKSRLHRARLALREMLKDLVE